MNFRKNAKQIFVLLGVFPFWNIYVRHAIPIHKKTVTDMKITIQWPFNECQRINPKQIHLNIARIPLQHMIKIENNGISQLSSLNFTEQMNNYVKNLFSLFLKIKSFQEFLLLYLHVDGVYTKTFDVCQTAQDF